MAQKQRKNPVTTGWSKITHSRRRCGVQRSGSTDWPKSYRVYTSPNSPDTNILDLGFFRAIQSFNDACPDNEEELIKSVEKAYGEYPWCKLNFVWLTLQSCLNKIIEHDGGNDYKILHMGKESLWRRGRLPEVLHVTPAANAWLNPTMDDDSDQDSDDLGDDMLFPMSTATSMVAMDGEEGENAPTDGIMTTGV